MSWGAIGVAGIGAVVNLSNASKNRADAKEAARLALIEKEKQQLLLNQQKEQYKGMTFTNPYANMENTFEDLTINQQAADFQTGQLRQSQANILDQIKTTAGTSGIGASVQALVNQGQLATAQIGAGIGQQEAANQRLAAQAAGKIQSYEAQGQQWVQQSEMDRQATLLGMQMGEAAGANEALAQARANEINAQLAQQQVTADLFSTTSTALANNADVIGGEDNKFWTKI
mgnify:CR=1 FL=1